MKEVCERVGMSYETLRFYCNEGLVPNVARDKNNYRSFDERNIRWLESLQCLKRCGMSIQDMRVYMNLCLAGKSSIPERKRMLDILRAYLLSKLDEINASIEFIDTKQAFYDGVLTGELPYTSNLIAIDE
jgi:DNA-binding transcriptional MerR regulator